jgi:hypothetical protein
MAESSYTPPGSSGSPIRVFAITSHTHSLGVRSTIEHMASGSPMLLHESLDWAEPPLTQLDPPLVFTGSESLRLRCEYQNDTNRDVMFGTAFEDEMCFMWVYYY